MRYRTVALLLALGACASDPSPWFLADGRSVLSDPQLLQRGEQVRAACRMEANKAIMSGQSDNIWASLGARRTADEIFVDCMLAHGYTQRR